MPRARTPLAWIEISVATLAILAAVGYGVYRAVNPPPAPPGGVVCTQEVKQCPDGSYVSRRGPRCGFAPCPSALPLPSPEPTLDTPNWKIYRNEQYGFAFKYPPNFDVINDSDKLSITDYSNIEEGPGAFYERAARDTWESRLRNQSRYRVGSLCAEEDIGLITDFDPREVACTIFSIDPYVIRMIKPNSVTYSYTTSRFEANFYDRKSVLSDTALRTILSTFIFAK